MKRTVVVLLIGIAVGALSVLVVTAGDEDDKRNFDALGATDASAVDDEVKSDGMYRPEDESDESCEETLAMVQEAHATAIEDYSKNEEMVDYLSELVERSGAASPAGKAMGFPEELDDHFHPDSFARAVEELQTSSPDFFGDETDVDCEEYPCIIEFQSDERPRDIDFDDRCPAIEEQFGDSGLRSNGVEIGEDIFVQLIPTGTGVGLAEHLDSYRGNLDKRLRHRWQSRRQKLSADRYEEACMFEGDADACIQMARAMWSLPEEREVYLVLGCDERDARACHSYARSRCIDRGRCDATSEEFARRAIRLDTDNERYHRTLGALLCERGQSAGADAAWQRACNLGHTASCDRRCPG